MNEEYDKKLKELEWFKRHPQFLPFVGDKYNVCKILQIGESHYISGKRDNDGFGLCYFKNHWWEDGKDKDGKDFAEQYGECFNTKTVITNYIGGDKSGRGYNIYTNPLKSFSDVVLGKKIEHIDQENKKLYRYFAFMNFYQMPSLYEGESYYNSLKKLATDKKDFEEIFKRCVEKSIHVVDEVIDILDPNVIVFTSSSARDQYQGKKYPELKGKYKDDNKRVIYTPHPCCSHWYRSGKEEFKKGLNNIPKEKRREIRDQNDG